MSARPERDSSKASGPARRSARLARVATAVLIVAAATLARAGESADAAREAAARLEQRIKSIVETADKGPQRSSRPAIEEARGLLMRRGLDRNLVDALTEAPRESSIETGPGPLPAQVLSTVRRRLLAFADAVEASPRAASPIPTDEARARLETILRDPIFSRAPGKASLLERLRAGLNDGILSLVRGLLGAVERYPVFIRVTIAIFIALAMLVCLFVLAPAVRRLFARRAAPEPGPSPSGIVHGDDAALLLSRAAAEAASGRHLTALKLYEKAAVVALRARGDLPPRPGMTDLEGVRHLQDRSAGTTRAVFERLATIHDRSIYARGETGGSLVDEAATLAKEIVAAGEERAA